jgi:hypothetical protein
MYKLKPSLSNNSKYLSFFFQAVPVLRIGSNKNVTMSQRHAATLLACAFFCLFPYRSDKKRNPAFDRYPNPNFERYVYI